MRAIGLGLRAVSASGLLIATGFPEIGHLVDPCDRSWWEFPTTIGDERLCSAQADIAVRFPLHLPGASGALTATVAAVISRRSNLFDWWPPEGRPGSEV